MDSKIFNFMTPRLDVIRPSAHQGPFKSTDILMAFADQRFSTQPNTNASLIQLLQALPQIPTPLTALIKQSPQPLMQPLKSVTGAVHSPAIWSLLLTLTPNEATPIKQPMQWHLLSNRPLAQNTQIQIGLQNHQLLLTLIDTPKNQSAKPIVLLNLPQLLAAANLNHQQTQNSVATKTHIPLTLSNSAEIINKNHNLTLSQSMKPSSVTTKPSASVQTSSDRINLLIDSLRHIQQRDIPTYQTLIQAVKPSDHLHPSLKSIALNIQSVDSQAVKNAILKSGIFFEHLRLQNSQRLQKTTDSHHSVMDLKHRLFNLIAQHQNQAKDSMTAKMTPNTQASVIKTITAPSIPAVMEMTPQKISASSHVSTPQIQLNLAEQLKWASMLIQRIQINQIRNLLEQTQQQARHSSNAKLHTSRQFELPILNSNQQFDSVQIRIVHQEGNPQSLQQQTDLPDTMDDQDRDDPNNPATAECWTIHMGFNLEPIGLLWVEITYYPDSSDIHSVFRTESTTAIELLKAHLPEFGQQIRNKGAQSFEWQLETQIPESAAPQTLTKQYSSV